MQGEHPLECEGNVGVRRGNAHRVLRALFAAPAARPGRHAHAYTRRAEAESVQTTHWSKATGGRRRMSQLRKMPDSAPPVTQGTYRTSRCSRIARTSRPPQPRHGREDEDVWVEPHRRIAGPSRQRRPDAPGVENVLGAAAARATLLLHPDDRGRPRRGSASLPANPSASSRSDELGLGRARPTRHPAGSSASVASADTCRLSSTTARLVSSAGRERRVRGTSRMPARAAVTSR